VALRSPSRTAAGPVSLIVRFSGMLPESAGASPNRRPRIVAASPKPAGTAPLRARNATPTPRRGSGCATNGDGISSARNAVLRNARRPPNGPAPSLPDGRNGPRPPSDPGSNLLGGKNARRPPSGHASNPLAVRNALHPLSGPASNPPAVRSAGPNRSASERPKPRGNDLPRLHHPPAAPPARHPPRRPTGGKRVVEATPAAGEHSQVNEKRAPIGARFHWVEGFRPRRWGRRLSGSVRRRCGRGGGRCWWGGIPRRP